MIQSFLLTLLVGATLYGSATTTVSFPGEETFIKVDEHGNRIYNQSVKIETGNFEVKNFWKKFSMSGDIQDPMHFPSISKSGTVQISVEASSICSLYPQLDTNGCSGQKPFLINDEALNGKVAGDTITLTFQKDYDGNILYTPDNNFSFYPLDVNRTGKYYKKPTTPDTACHSFFCVMTGMFDNFFGIDFFADFFDFPVSNTQANQLTDDVRQRYIANITSGIDQNHLMQRNVTTIDKDQNTYTFNTHNPVSLIDYVENSSATGSCNLGFFSFGSNSTFCNFMSGMPFISFFASQTPSQVYVIDTIQVDTENAIIAFAGAYSGVNVTEYETVVNTTLTNDASTNFPPFEVMKSMMCMMMPFMSCDDETVEQEKGRIKDSYYTFDEADATTLAMAVTNDGTQIDNFQTFKLLGIHSIVGDGNVTVGSSCSEVEKYWEVCFWGCVKFSETAISSPSSQECDTYKDGISINGKTWKSVDYVTGASSANDSGRVLSLDLKLVELNTLNKSAKLRYKLISTD